MFECSVEDFSTLSLGIEPDGDGEEIKWLEIDALENSVFFPKAIIPYLKNIKDIKETIILGDVN